ncbi:glycosyltransferase family 2 protein [Williamsia herbipolensis]|uniref:glycosyltransferase family 2 protein n=1 Tax=Williamsia herbipolensis TaxID=1603258 RepID=UPI001364AFA4|nr:glycosyltransferase family 2 protein [Williamsia herbipolensis]
MKVLAAVVNYNSTSDLIECVRSLAASGVTYIRILDNHSAEWLKCPIQALAFTEEIIAVAPEIISVRSALRNIGFGPGVNLLLEDTESYDYVWIVNPDVVVSRAAVDELLAVAVASAADLISPIISTNDGSSIWFAGGNLKSVVGLTEHLTNITQTENSQLSKVSGFSTCTFLTGAALLVREESWRKLGGFREDLFLYWEDADLCLRAMELGMVLGVAEPARVWHRVGGSAGGEKSAVYYFYMNRNRLAVCGGKRLWRRVDILAVRGLRFTLRLLRMCSREKHDVRAKMTASFRGIQQGLRGQMQQF